MKYIRRRDFTIGLATAPFAGLSCLGQQDRPDFSGRWELDTDRSQMPTPAPKDLVELIEHHNHVLTVRSITSHRFPDEPIAITLALTTIEELTTTTDGAETSQSWGPGEVRFHTRWDGPRLLTEWAVSLHGQPAIAGTWLRSLAEGGRAQILEIHARSLQAAGAGEAKLVFVKK